MSTNNTKTEHFLQKKWFKNILWLAIFLAIFLLLRPFMQGDVLEGKLPAETVQTITGDVVDFSKIDKPTLIHFWATWCPICEFSKEGIEEIAKDFAVINIAVNSGDDSTLFEYAATNNLNPAIIVNDERGEMLNLFGAKAVPADFIVDTDGKIKFVEVGFSSPWGLRIRLWLASFN